MARQANIRRSAGTQKSFLPAWSFRLKRFLSFKLWNWKHNPCLLAWWITPNLNSAIVWLAWLRHRTQRWAESSHILPARYLLACLVRSKLSLFCTWLSLCIRRTCFLSLSLSLYPIADKAAAAHSRSWSRTNFAMSNHRPRLQPLIFLISSSVVRNSELNFVHFHSIGRLIFALNWPDHGISLSSKSFGLHQTEPAKWAASSRDHRSLVWLQDF